MNSCQDVDMDKSTLWNKTIMKFDKRINRWHIQAFRL